jgi:acetylornithine/succinyldiaminopimelate/putrescine aminotransferase
VTLAKALAGGVAAGGLVAKPQFAEKLVPGTHAATFGGNPIACRAALATIETIAQDDLLARALRLEKLFHERFDALQKRCPLIQDIRIKGVMIGIELSCDGAPIVDHCLQRQLLINCTHGNVIRLLPALNLADDQLKAGCDILDDVLLGHKP